MAQFHWSLVISGCNIPLCLMVSSQFCCLNQASKQLYSQSKITSSCGTPKKETSHLGLVLPLSGTFGDGMLAGLSHELFLSHFDGIYHLVINLNLWNMVLFYMYIYYIYMHMIYQKKYLIFYSG